MSTKKLDVLREQIEKLVAEHDDLESAPLARAEAEARFVHLIARVQDDHILGMGPGNLRDGGTERGFAEWLARPGFLCEVFGSEIKECLLRRFDAAAGETAGLPAGERRKRLTELDGQIYQLEQEEERQIELLEADGVDVQRRPDADPRAQLGLAPGREAA